MGSTVFVNGVTLTDAAWFNDVNVVTYNVLGDSTTPPTTAVAAMKNLFKKGADIASATTTNLAAATGNYVHITGTTTITSFGTVNAGVPFWLVFDGSLLLTHNGTSLILPGGTSINTSAGDMLQVTSEGSGNWRVNWYVVASLPIAAFPAMHIQGLIASNNAGDATNDLDISAGQCRDATNVHNLIVAALTKQSDVAWAVGSGNGGLDTGAVGNSDYYIWAIKRSDTGITDILYSLSSTAPTMPTNYDFKRLIGWFKRVGGTIVAFKSYEIGGGGIELLWNAPTLDINLGNTLTTSRRTDAIKVPLNFSVTASVNVQITDAAATYTLIVCPDQTDAAASSTNANIRSIAGNTAAATLLVRTSSTGTIAARSDTATVDLYTAETQGFIWARKN